MKDLTKKESKDMPEERRIFIVMLVTGSDFKTAKQYLIAEEWNIDNAVISLKGDRR
ncbi:MAG: hypothetical protein UR95_C0010G0010 [Parcubacteria group bacterium GW2011_GWC1_36_108]|nr:MAG: hypothetical protein UR95_C0010G0010 [Parcubacteria group bacterium GW2011_GWC1_36_108]